MKWVAKKELFDLPVIGWMMKLAGDISVDRKAANRKKATFEQARFNLENQCSVMFFPEGTRSRNGELKTSTKGAFELASREKVDLLPLVIDGTQNTLPKKSWKFGLAKNIRLKVLDPISTKNFNRKDITELTLETRSKIADQLEEWRIRDEVRLKKPD
jgi:1-acyl-sn-glycerol-3-phosphate acyltransferase